MHPFEDLAVPEDGIGIHWFGQSTFGLKHPDGMIVQVDPYYPRERPAEAFLHTRPPLDESTLRTDYVLLTHNHLDHTFPESLLRIDAAFPDVRYVGPPESIANMTASGLPRSRMTTITAGQTTGMGPIRVHAVWSKLPGGIPADNIAPPDVQHLGYVLEIGRVRVYISGDPVNTFSEHEELLAPVRTLKPHIGFLTNHPSEGEFPFFKGSVKIAVSLGLDTAVPSHYQCFVSRNYDPQEWAALLPSGGPKPLIIPYNQSAVYRSPEA
jgi:L-ascorbate metabolism protein UlaG (beta-lactamase superfamily)